MHLQRLADDECRFRDRIGGAVREHDLGALEARGSGAHKLTDRDNGKTRNSLLALCAFASNPYSGLMSASLTTLPQRAISLLR